MWNLIFVTVRYLHTVVLYEMFCITTVVDSVYFFSILCRISITVYGL
jgi:hypothetical protein